jgi:hypothetical protein
MSDASGREGWCWAPKCPNHRLVGPLPFASSATVLLGHWPHFCWSLFKGDIAQAVNGFGPVAPFTQAVPLSVFVSCVGCVC